MKPRRYQRIPQKYYAIEFIRNGPTKNIAECVEFTRGHLYYTNQPDNPSKQVYMLKTKLSNVIMDDGDMIVKLGDREFTKYSREHFETMYESI